MKQAKILNDSMQRTLSTIQTSEEFKLFNSAYSYHTQGLKRVVIKKKKKAFQ